MHLGYKQEAGFEATTSGKHFAAKQESSADSVFSGSQYLFASKAIKES
jgi:hypothetical protein